MLTDMVEPGQGMAAPGPAARGRAAPDRAAPDRAAPDRAGGRPALLARSCPRAGDPRAGAAAVSAGADLVELGDVDEVAVAAFRRAHPGIGVCTDAGPGDLVRDPRAAMAAGAVWLCADPGAAAASGLPPDRVLVTVSPAGLAAATAAGWAVLVDVDQAPPGAGEPTALAAIVASAAISSWLGAAVIATCHVRPVRRALDMTASIRGTRPPARAIRGLA